MQESALTEDERKTLQETLSLTEDKLNLLLNASGYVFEQALYNSLSPEKLSEQLLLLNAGLQEEHAHAFQLVWQNYAKDYVAKMRERTLGGPSLLKETNWRLQIKVGQDTSQKEKVPTAIFDFVTGTEDAASKNETLSVEFSKADLYKFFDNLEKIQEQLDSLM